MILLALALLAASPSNITGVLASAKPGDTVRLVAGRYPAVAFKNRTFSPALEVDATGATVLGVTVTNSTGVHWTGGTLAGDATLPVAAGYGFIATLSKDVTIKQVRVSDYHTGIVFDRVDGGAVSGNWIARMGADGVDIAMSHNLVVDHNACSDFRNAPGAHPDCVQLWSRPQYPPTSDITITANSVVGAMQGISLFNHVRDGVDDGGFDRIRISGNTVLNTFADAITAYDCRGCTIVNNSVSSLPNYLNRAQLYVSGGSVSQCGNDVPMVPRQSTAPCKS